MKPSSCTLCPTYTTIFQDRKTASTQPTLIDFSGFAQPKLRLTINAHSLMERIHIYLQLHSYLSPTTFCTNVIAHDLCIRSASPNRIPVVLHGRLHLFGAQFALPEYTRNRVLSASIHHLSLTSSLFPPQQAMPCNVLRAEWKNGAVPLKS